MKINPKGVSFTYYGDIILFYWPWKREGYKFKSNVLNLKFNSFKEYWKQIGALSEVTRRSKNITGRSWPEVLDFWVTCNYPTDIVVVAYDINYCAKPKSFWVNLPKEVISTMQKDIVIFTCKDLNQAIDIKNSFDCDAFGIAHIFKEGNLYE